MHKVSLVYITSRWHSRGQQFDPAYLHQHKVLPPMVLSNHFETAPFSMRNYISVLVIEIQHAIAAEISYQSKMKITSVNTIKGLMYTALSEED